MKMKEAPAAAVCSGVWVCVQWYVDLPYLHSFPTRRSSDLSPMKVCGTPLGPKANAPADSTRRIRLRDRKSTRLNSSHTVISYAVFCLKKKNRNSKSLHVAATGRRTTLKAAPYATGSSDVPM